MPVDYSENDATRTAEIRVRGKVTKEDYVKAVEPLQAFIDRHGSVKLIEIIDSFSGFDPSVLWRGLKFDWQNIRHITHVAIVSDVGWIGPVSRAAGALISSDVRMFGMDELDAARDWTRNA